jgi:hypothetical protein
MVQNYSYPQKLKGLMFLIMIIGLTSCAKKYSFPVSQVVPAAKGTFTVKKDKNKNYVIDLSVKNLAGPERLQPPQNTYVVWIESEEGTKNIGRLNVGDKLSGSLETVTAFKPTLLFITAEEDASVSNPGMQVVLKTDRFKVK